MWLDLDDRIRDAREINQRLIVLRERLAADFPPERQFQIGLATQYDFDGTHSMREGDYEQAEKALLRSIDVWRRILREPSTDTADYHLAALVLYNLHTARIRLGNHAGAEQALRDWVNLHEERHRRFPNGLHTQVGVANAWFQLAGLLVEGGKVESGLAAYDHVLEQSRTADIQDPRGQRMIYLQHASFAAQARLWQKAGNNTRALQLWDRAVGYGGAQRPMYLIERAETMAATGQRERALAEVKMLLPVSKKEAGQLFQLAAIAARVADSGTRTAEAIGTALDALQKAHALGFFIDPVAAKQQLAHPDFAALQQNPGFRAFVTKVVGSR